MKYEKEYIKYLIDNDFDNSLLEKYNQNEIEFNELIENVNMDFKSYKNFVKSIMIDEMLKH
jgi:hypothetical protein